MARSTPYHVLVFPGGTEIGLEIRRALGACKEVVLFSAGLAISNHAPYVFREHEELPSIHEDGWIDALNALIARHGIDYIFPAYDDVLLALAENATRIDATPVTSPLVTCQITRSKTQTYATLEGYVDVPRQYTELIDVTDFPIFLKPDRGQGSQRTYVVRDRAELESLVAAHEDLIVLEHLPGEEFTIDCFSDRERGLLFCGGRRRVRTRAGISMHSEAVDDDTFEPIARAIESRLELHGAWFFQLKRDAAGTLKLLEVAPRVAGTMALHRAHGVNFPLLSLYEQERIPVEIRPNPVTTPIDRALVNHYAPPAPYSAAYVDLDDTLILRERVNTELLRFLYQCINDQIRVVLLTRHADDLDATLSRHRLRGVFDEVVHLDRAASKANHIRETDAIFIDDSFAERKQVAEALGIRTYDSSMLEVLLDDRA